MDTSDDPVVEEAERAVRTVSKEFRRSTEDIGEEFIRPFEHVGSEIRRASRSVEKEVSRIGDMWAIPEPAPSAPLGAVASPPISPVATAPTSPVALTPVTDAKERKRRLAQAATLTQDWLPPTLGTPGLLGLT